MSSKFYYSCMSFGKFAGCHQRPDRSFFINGHQFPVCARCTGVLIGQYSALILYRMLSLPAVILVSFCAVMFLDWLLQYLDMIITNIFTTTDPAALAACAGQALKQGTASPRQCGKVLLADRPSQVRQVRLRAQSELRKN